TYAMRPLLPMPLLAVGAAFDYHAGQLRKPPAWMQQRGLEWLWRLGLEPGRLWERDLLLHPAYPARLRAPKTELSKATPPPPPRRCSARVVPGLNYLKLDRSGCGRKKPCRRSASSTGTSIRASGTARYQTPARTSPAMSSRTPMEYSPISGTTRELPRDSRLI